MKNITKNSIHLFILAFFIAESILILIGTYSYREKRSHILEDRTNQLKTSYESIFNIYSLSSNVIFEQIINKPQITKLFSRAYKSNLEQQKEIRDSLFLLLNETYLELSSLAIKQLHFHLPDNTSFLRFHRPNKFGDNLTDARESVRIANAEKRYIQGFEEGKIYNGFRFVYPLFYEGEHIGSVETSISFGAINQMLFKQAKNLYSFILKKSTVEEKVFEEEKSNYTRSSISDQWVEEIQFLHNKNRIETISKETLEELDKVIKNKYQEKLNYGFPFSVFIPLRNNNYTVSFVPVNNLKNEHTAYVISYMTDTHISEYNNDTTVFIFIGTLLLLIITLLFYIVYKKNITIEKQQGAIEESESRYMQIYNTIDIGILSSNLDGEILMANPKIIEILGFDNLVDLKKYKVNDFYVDADLRQKLINELREGNAKLINQDILWKKKDGSQILVKLIGKMHTDKNGIHYLESIIQDITDMSVLQESIKNSEANLRQSNAEKDRFFSILAHDLRGPFNSLIGLIEVVALHPEEVDKERKIRFIEVIHESVKNLSNLIENLLEWSRSQQGVINCEPVEIALKELVEETVDLLSESAFSKQIFILPTIEENIKLLADENMTKTIIRNLISNAIKYTHKEGLIKVYPKNRIKRDDKIFIEIVVEDNGVGISENDLDKLFKIDSGFTNPGTENEKGTGLGLLIIKEFIEKHGGSLIIESELGIGTKAIFTLPIAV